MSVERIPVNVQAASYITKGNLPDKAFKCLEAWDALPTQDKTLQKAKGTAEAFLPHMKEFALKQVNCLVLIAQKTQLQRIMRCLEANIGHRKGLDSTTTKKAAQMDGIALAMYESRNARSVF